MHILYIICRTRQAPPPANTALVGDPNPVKYAPENVEFPPKSTAFPLDAILTYCIKFVNGDGPPAQKYTTILI